MDVTGLTNLEPPRLQNLKPMLIAGLSGRYNAESASGIPALWQRFAQHLGHIPGQVGYVAWGAVYNSEKAGDFDYMSGVEVSDFSGLPAELHQLRIPEQRYAVFRQPGHISTMQQTWNTIWTKAMPESGYRVADGPRLERYGEEFDAQTGNGGFEIWIPVQT